MMTPIVKLVILIADDDTNRQIGHADDDTISPSQRLGLPRHLLVPGSREESTTEVEEEEQEETEREEEEDLELTFLCNPQVFQLKEEVEEGRRRLKECKVSFHKFSSQFYPSFNSASHILPPAPPPGLDSEVECGQSADDGERVELPQPVGGGRQERHQFFLPGDEGGQERRQFFFPRGSERQFFYAGERGWEERQFHCICERGEQPCV